MAKRTTPVAKLAEILAATAAEALIQAPADAPQVAAAEVVVVVVAAAAAETDSNAKGLLTRGTKRRTMRPTRIS